MEASAAQERTRLRAPSTQITAYISASTPSHTHYSHLTPHTSRLPQVVPLPLNDQAESGVDGDGDSPAAEGSLPIQALVEAAVRVAGAGPMQPVEVRDLPYRCYAAALGESER